MRFVLFYHSLVSDWNHGNAHFLRGIAAELLARGHRVDIYEPADGWSRSNLLAESGPEAVRQFERAFPQLRSTAYELSALNLDEILDGADVVIVHEWNSRRLVRKIGEHRKRGRFRLLFHDTHHRCVSNPESIGDLREYDGVLAFGESLRQRYQQLGRAKTTWVWHEAADLRVFYPRRAPGRCGDLVWIGNWGDEERTAELREFLISPAARLRLRARIHGVRYPDAAVKEINAAGIQYCGWIPNFQVPDAFAAFDMTVHVPRRPYREQLNGVPTIRVFEALACKIPLVCAPWNDSEHLFEPGKDFLVARDGAEMTAMLAELSRDESLRNSLGEHGLRTIRERHTCAHRVDQLLDIVRQA
jgi:spore maturation protein CgeB